MPGYECKYNPRTDIKKVSPTGSLDLKAAFVNNAIPANLEVTEAKFNGIDDPAAIAGRVHDTIDAEVTSKAIRDYKPPKKEDE